MSCCPELRHTKKSLVTTHRVLCETIHRNFDSDGWTASSTFLQTTHYMRVVLSDSVPRRICPWGAATCADDARLGPAFDLRSISLLESKPDDY
jgi:hypothetical protein